MSYAFRCYTLFDIEQTGANTRKRYGTKVDESSVLIAKQCNFDTILQILSLRTQPELISEPTRMKKHDKLFGNQSTCWMFEFRTYHQFVFGENLSLLNSDCSQVPMILTPSTDLLSPYLSTTFEPNIYFEEIHETAT